jgi:hypothetical protein
MNRHARRRAAKVAETEVVSLTVTPEIAAAILAMPTQCCGSGCQASYTGSQPPDWRMLLIFWSSRPISTLAQIPDATWDRDGVLCPHHAAELDGLLKFVGRGPLAAPQGTA